MASVKNNPLSQQYRVEANSHLDLANRFQKDHEENPHGGFQSGVALHGIGYIHAKTMAAYHAIKGQ